VEASGAGCSDAVDWPKQGEPASESTSAARPGGIIM
jgi:hypothetical protein